MQILNFRSLEQPELNAEILRIVDRLTKQHHDILPDGWRAIIKFQDKSDPQPYYHLDLQSDNDGGDFAPVKMQMLELFPSRAATGGDSPDSFCSVISRLQARQSPTHHIPSEIANSIMNKLPHLTSLSELDRDYWQTLSHYGLTRYYGAIRIPYNALVTERHEAFLAREKDELYIRPSSGEIRISFSGAKEWQDLFLAVSILKSIQKSLRKLWTIDQISYCLKDLQADPQVNFWLQLLKVHEY